MARSVDDWTERLTDALTTSVEHAQAILTNDPEVQDWLRPAALEAAMHLQGGHDPIAAAQAYGDLLDGLHRTLPHLIEAVAAVTGGHGRLDVDWRPMTPEYSRLNLTFRLGVKPDLLVRLKEIEEGAIEALLTSLVAHLPPGDPFPGRPHRVRAVLLAGGHAIGLELQASSGGDRSQDRYSLKAQGGHWSDPYPLLQTTQALHQGLSS
ncbi:MAG: hypothetical protein AAF970_14480 [Bacteroidota bacterium]